MTAATSGGEVLAELLVAAGVRYVFGVAGGALTPFLGALATRPEITYVGVRHEAAGALMATALYQSDGELAVCLAEQGPGTHNLVAGLGPARTNSLAVLAISVSGHALDAAPSRGPLMDLDAVTALRALTKSSARVSGLERLAEVLRRAVRSATTGRPGPVHVDIPRNVLAGVIETPDPAEWRVGRAHWSPLSASPAPAGEVARAVAVLAAARRPLVLVGGGAARAGAAEACATLVSRLGAAVTTTQTGIGVARSDAPTFVGQGGVIGGPGVIRALKEADAVVAIGCRMSSWLWSHGEPLVAGWPHQELVQIDVDPEVVGHLRPVSVGLVGDARAVTEQLVAGLPELPSADLDHRWVASLVADLSAHRAALAALASAPGTEGAKETDVDGAAMHPAALAAAVAAAVPDDALVVLDGGHVSFWSNSFLRATAPGRLLHDAGMGQLGIGLPYANALAVRHPDRTIVNLTGDGSFGFTVAELDTARRYHLRALHVVADNATWGVVSAAQQRAGFSFGTDLSGTDYAAVARGFGCYGERVEHGEQLGAALRRALDHDGPAVLDVRVRWEPHPMFAAFGAMTSRPPT